MDTMLSPVELHNGIWFKREDSSGGQKGRQLRFMVSEYLAESPGPHGLLSSSPGTSPQTVFAAREARANAIPCILVVGVNTMKATRAFTNIQIAEALGAEVILAGASPNGWRRHRKFKAICAANPTYFVVPEGLGPCKDDPAWLERFYHASAPQVQNLPEDVKVLIIPTGSGNSTISILLGLAEYRFDTLPEHIVLGLLGHAERGGMRPTVEAHIRRGLASNKLAVHLFESSERIDVYPKSEYGKKCKPPQVFDGIRFHPNYEAKLWKLLVEKRPDLLAEGTCCWIVGAEPTWAEFGLEQPTA
jgi:hypothetical protein